MIRVGVIGAPGAGKSELVQAVTEKYYKNQVDIPETIVDNYLDQFGERGVATGQYASVYVHTWAWFLRKTAETTPGFEGDFVITAGTGFDTVAHVNWITDRVDLASLTLEGEKILVNARLLTDYLIAEFPIYDLAYILPIGDGDLDDPDYAFSFAIDKKIKNMSLSANLMIPLLTDTPAKNRDRIVKDVKAAVKKEQDIADVSQ